MATILGGRGGGQERICPRPPLGCRRARLTSWDYRLGWEDLSSPVLKANLPSSSIKGHSISCPDGSFPFSSQEPLLSAPPSFSPLCLPSRFADTSFRPPAASLRSVLWCFAPAKAWNHQDEPTQQGCRAQVLSLPTGQSAALPSRMEHRTSNLAHKINIGMVGGFGI